MARGQTLYQDVWEQRPPGIYWIYLAGFTLLGWTAAAVAWLDAIAAAATMALIYVTVVRIETRGVALTGAGLYGVLTLPAWLYGHGGFLERSVCETFIVVCVAAAAACAVRMDDDRRLLRAASLGFFCGAAVILKPNAGLYLPALLAWTWLYRSSARSRRALVRATVVALIGAAIAPGAAIVWLWTSGAIGEARIAVLDFNRYYVGEGLGTPAHGLAFAKAVWLRMKTDPLWLAGSAAGLVAVVDFVRRRRLPPVAALGVLWGSAAALVIIVNGSRLFNSYFINALPPLALLGGWWLAESVRGAGARRLLAVTTACLMAVLLVQRDFAGRVFRWTRDDLAALTGRMDADSHLERFGGYANQRGYSARANAELARYLQERTGADERVYLFGINGAGVYFASDRLTAHRFLRVNFFVETDFPDPRFRLDAVIRDLSTSLPRYIVFERLHSASAMGRAADALPDRPEVQALLRSYTLETTIEDFTLYRRITPPGPVPQGERTPRPRLEATVVEPR